MIDDKQLPIANPTEIATTSLILNKLASDFLASQDVKPSSRNLYKRTLRQYFHWIQKNALELPNITREEILRYKQTLLDSGMSSLTVGSYLTIVRKFYEWAEGEKYYPNVAKGVKTPTRKQAFRKQPLTTAQSKALLLHFEKKPLRDYAIINLMLRTGLRTIEIIRANREDIIFRGEKRILLIWGKGKDEKDSFVILTDKAYKPIEDYLKTKRKGKDGDPLFSSTSNNSKEKRLSTRTISKIAKEGLKAVGLDDRHYTAHSLRHTPAVNILRAGGKIEDAQGVLRHSSPVTTQIYTATIKEEMRLKNAAEELLDSIF
jgi:integrase/recombinase XerC/integrase/recombinase XerD